MHVLKDPTLNHQINLVFDRDAKVVVTCNCWATNRSATNFSKNFGLAPDIATAWERYNDRESHNPNVPWT